MTATPCAEAVSLKLPSTNETRAKSIGHYNLGIFE